MTSKLFPYTYLLSALTIDANSALISSDALEVRLETDVVRVVAAAASFAVARGSAIERKEEAR